MFTLFNYDSDKSINCYNVVRAKSEKEKRNGKNEKMKRGRKIKGKEREAKMVKAEWNQNENGREENME